MKHRKTMRPKKKLPALSQSFKRRFFSDPIEDGVIITPGPNAGPSVADIIWRDLHLTPEEYWDRMQRKKRRYRS